MAREIHSEIKSILNLLQGNSNKFLIPIYQRPYSWNTKEHCQQLWDDILDFIKLHIDKNGELSFDGDEYFLGSIVVFRNENSEFEIIDGQQRITTLTLLYRALYEETKNIKPGWARNFGKCIWLYDEGEEKFSFKNKKLNSKVITDTNNEILNKILDENLYEGNTKNKYFENFNFFVDKIKSIPSLFELLCKTLIDDGGKLKILFINCDEQENALRIFNTLNNRGMPLSDADIFKGIIYGYQNGKDAKNKFANDWKNLQENLEKNKLDINDIFMHYYHALRARDRNKERENALRKFFNKDRLKDDKIFSEILELSKFILGEYNDKISLSAGQLFDVIHIFPNQYPKHLIASFYFYCKDKGKDFFDDAILLPFLNKMFANILVIYINNPTRNAIKDPIFNAYVSLYEKDELDFKFYANKILNDKDLFKQSFYKVNDSMHKVLLTLYLYLNFPNQDVIYGEIEHILPRNWQDACYQNLNKEEAKEYIENIGNKMWLEKALNIKARNYYFKAKREKYKDSKFLEAKKLSEIEQDEWGKEDILKRQEQIFERLYIFLKENINCSVLFGK